jgi:plastocyanin
VRHALRWTLAGVALLASAALGVAATSSSAVTSDPTTRRAEIAMRGNSFRPRRVIVSLGDTVLWVNRDIVRHDAVKPGLFDSGELRGGESFAWVPSDTGVVEYRCTIHQRMRGEIRVRPAP